ncbi:FKBP-type peptidyl-prolyl cis-trans isomerase [Capillimicrobium parvum]|uniref:FKBP-type peptidyl-prolyl cis-trans isomerase n=1 Tax=Capillimicrobium parvum TaxID=2884022 RepID=UPI003899044D
MDQKPEVNVPDRPAPRKLKIRDIVEGTGAEAKAGDVVTADYVGVLYKSGKQFDASWDRGQPINFQLGVGQVIPGWDQGLQGMKVGGRRELTIPPDLAYGTEGSPPVIPPNAPLVFVVDLRAVEPG